MSIFQFSLSQDVETDICIFGIYQQHIINEKPFYNTIHVEGIDKRGGVEIETVLKYFKNAIDKIFTHEKVKQVGEYVFDVETSKGIQGIEKFRSKFINELVENDYYFIDM